MWVFKKIKYKYDNASDRTQRELKLLLVLFCAALLINIPSLLSNMKVYSAWKLTEAENGWKVTSPDQQAMDSVTLKGIDKVFGKVIQPCSIIVARHNSIVYEKFYNGMSKGNYNNVYGITSSVVSSLMGIAIDRGSIDSTGENLDMLFPEYCNNADPLFSNITIDNLLTMTPGFCEDYSSWLKEENMVKAVFGLPVKNEPGTEFLYSDSSAHLLSAIIEKATGTNSFKYARDNLFEPLSIEDTKWGLDNQDVNTGYANLYMNARDMAKFGQLYLDNGKWKGRQVISEEWVKKSTEMLYKFKDEEKSSEGGYGYNWWITEVSGFKTFSALGYGGQSITVVPGLDIVMVITSRPDATPFPMEDQRLKLLKSYVIPSVTDKK